MKTLLIIALLFVPAIANAETFGLGPEPLTPTITLASPQTFGLGGFVQQQSTTQNSTCIVLADGTVQCSPAPLRQFVNVVSQPVLRVASTATNMTTRLVSADCTCVDCQCATATVSYPAQTSYQTSYQMTYESSGLTGNTAGVFQQMGTRILNRRSNRSGRIGEWFSNRSRLFQARSFCN